MPRSRLALVLFGASLLGACGSDGQLVLAISSPLAIPSETNVLAVVLKSPSGAESSATYALGAPPRHAWPQTLPIVAKRDQREVEIRIRLERTRPGASNRLVGWVAASLELPFSGEVEFPIEVPRECTDLDGDGFGTGIGCKRLDCDDARADVPSINMCPVSESPACADLGRPCLDEEVCFAGVCMLRCSSSRPCPGTEFECLTGFEFCVCRFQCSQDSDCAGYGGGSCVHDCCQI